MQNGTTFERIAPNLMAYLTILKIYIEVVATISTFYQPCCTNTKLPTMVNDLPTKKRGKLVAMVQNGSLIQIRRVWDLPSAPTKGRERPSRAIVLTPTSMMSSTPSRGRVHRTSNFVDHWEGTKRERRRLQAENQPMRTY